MNHEGKKCLEGEISCMIKTIDHDLPLKKHPTTRLIFMKQNHNHFIDNFNRVTTNIFDVRE